MSYSLYAKLSLKTLKPTKISVRLANRSFQYPVGIVKNMLVEVGKFTFLTDFVILEMEEDSKVPLILGRLFLHTADAVIRVKQKQLNLRVGTERMIFHIDSMMKHSYLNDDTCFSIDVIDEILEEDFDALLDKEGIVLGHKVSEASIEVDKEKINVISKLPPPLISKLLEKDTQFEFDDECHNAFKLLKEKLKCAPLIVSLNWNLLFELMCDASDFAVRAILGQKDVLSKTIVHTDHSTLRYLFKKQDAKTRLIHWILLLQEFDIKIKDKKGTKNVSVDHLSWIENDETSDDSEVDDNFPGETLMKIDTRDEPWFTDFANYLLSDIIPKGMTYQQKNKFFSDLKHYFWEEPYLFKYVLTV
ncbi:reverse transcriptase domain-containing protein [Tanacetum coccineum]|uniref:Reverse transcriptase domain-containing protein n=1 Tax=Tanacetum coccineum TaxID=301880 RepID=A0ABQ5E3E3_9ASTR